MNHFNFLIDNKNSPYARKHNKWLPLVFLLLMILGWSTVSSIVNKKGHLADSHCSNCHVAQSDINANNAKLLVASQEKLCSSCHKDAIRNSHPSGFKPEMKIPSPYTVDWKGEITCSSCHHVHNLINRMNRSEYKGKDYCLSCHKPTFFEQMADKGTSLVGMGHLDARSSEENLLVDRFTLQCIACHSKLEGILNVDLANQGLIKHGGSGGSHPVGMLYQESALYGGYRPIEKLNTKIELPDGKVGCTSCHEGYSKSHGSLVIKMAGSQLCMECHDI